MKLLHYLAVVMLLLQPTFANAEHGKDSKHTHNHADESLPPSDKISITTKPGEAVIQVKGVVCSYCFFGVQKKLSKLTFVDKSKYNKGSIVDIDNQRITIAIKPGEAFDVQQVYKSVLDGGYDPVKAVVASKDKTVTYDAEGKLCTASC